MDSHRPSLVFDFDSTLVSVEGIDELFRHTISGRSDARALQDRFQALTDAGMDGQMSYEDSLEARLSLLRVDRDQVAAVGKELVGCITPSVWAERRRLAQEAARVWIVSGGFRELIDPVAQVLGLNQDQIQAQRFRWDGSGRLAGVDPETALARGGKPEAIARAGIPGPIWVIGDGATDLELREKGLAQRFFAFTENRRRPGVVDGADGELTSLAQLWALEHEPAENL